MKLRLTVASIICVLLFCAAAAPAQTTLNYTPAAEVFAGFSLHRTEFGSDFRNAPGFDFSFGYNMAKRLRLLADFGGQYFGTSDFIAGARVSTSNYQLLFGPEFVMRNKSRATPFVHGMFGWTTRRFNVPTGQQICNGITCQDQKATVISDSGLALALGGGFDYALTPMISIRPIQFDYIRSHMDRNDPNFLVDTSVLPPLNSWQKNYRFGVGVVLRLGEKSSKKY